MIVRIPSFSSDFPERCEKRCVSHVLPPKQISNAPFLVRNPGITREMVRFSFALAESHEKRCVSRLLWRNHTRNAAFLVCFGGITREMLRFSCFLRGHHQIARKRAHTAGVARARRDLPQKIFFHA